MKTIAFYSYKGGAGRTLLLANVAHALTRAGHKVLVLDLDLEAPGLHHKIVHGGVPFERLTRGIVDIIGIYEEQRRLPDDLAPYCVALGDEERPITLLPAGGLGLPHGLNAYWHAVRKIGWPELSDTGEGKLLFLELRRLIEEQFAPDYMLIDSQTGITELGGVATAVLADAVVMLALGNEESLRGTTTVVDAIRNTAPVPGRAVPEVHLVLTRQLEPPAEEVLVSMRPFVSRGERPTVLRQDPMVHQTDTVLLESPDGTPSPLLLDYLELIHKVLPELDMTPLVDPLVAEVASLEGEARIALLVRLGTLQLTPRLLSAWLAQRLDGASFVGALALLYAIAQLGTQEDLLDAVRALPSSSAGPRATEDDLALATVQRRWPELDEEVLRDFLVETLAPHLDDPAPLVMYASTRAADDYEGAVAVLDTARTLFPDSPSVLAALIELDLRHKDDRQLLDRLGPAGLWRETSALIRRWIGPDAAGAAARVGDEAWARALLDDPTQTEIGPVARAALLHLAGDGIGADLLLAATFGAARRFPSELDDLIDEATGFGMGETVRRLMDVLGVPMRMTRPRGRVPRRGGRRRRPDDSS